MSKTKYRKQNKIIMIIIMIIVIVIVIIVVRINNKTKVADGAYLSRGKKKGGLYNTYHELLSNKWIAKRSRFHASYIISPQSVAIFATSHLVGCIEY